ncbi:MAG TPA: class I SAM-dependent methyltransferase, partial [Fimbriimonadaceae bacterium]|nr:class I SAM-dependent methyltransferase [Fimbriimonadaceae bacterium]
MPEYDQNLLQTNLRQAGENLPGPDYYTVLEWIHRAHRPANYLEIGIRHGESIKRALPTTVCVGVDPLPQPSPGMPVKTTIFGVTSDEFFAHEDVRALLGGGRLECAFIDGLHLWEQALKDFINTEPFCGPGSLVL